MIMSKWSVVVQRWGFKTFFEQTVTICTLPKYTCKSILVMKQQSFFFFLSFTKEGNTPPAFTSCIAMFLFLNKIYAHSVFMSNHFPVCFIISPVHFSGTYRAHSIQCTQVSLFVFIFSINITQPHLYFATAQTVFV